MRKTLVLGLLLGLVASGVTFADEDWDAGVAAYKAKKYSEAAAAFGRYVDKVPDAYQGHMMLGQMLIKAKDYGKAASHLQTANELKANDPSIQLPLGQALLMGGKARDACAILSNVNEGALPKANQTVLYQLRATANCGGGSLADLQKIAESKNDGNSWAAYGVAALNDNKVDTAISALNKAVQLDGNNAKIRKSQISALVRKARTSKGGTKDSTYASAVQSASKLVQLDGSYNNHLLLGEVQLGAKQYNAAVGSLKAAASKNASDWLPNFYLGQAYTSLGDFDNAVTPLTKALGQTSKPADQKNINRQLGFVYEKTKDYAQSIQYYQKAGDSAGVARVTENQEIEQFNKEADAHNQNIKELEAAAERLKEEMEALPGQGPPPLR